MKLDEFQAEINKRWPVEAEWDWETPVFGLGGEAGEVIEEFKKALRYTRYQDPLRPGNGPMRENELARFLRALAPRKGAIILELGDSIHYSARIATLLGTSLEEVARRNLQKIDQRMQDVADRVGR